MIHTRCPCGKRLRVGFANIGKAALCPNCKQLVRTVAPNYQVGDGDFDAALIVEEAPERVGERIILGGNGPIEIGKLAEKHIILHSEKVSRTHCRLVRTAGGWRIEDQGSRNGIRLNGKRVPEGDLTDNDRIRIGEFHFRFAQIPLNMDDPSGSFAPPSPDMPPSESPRDDFDENLYQMAEMETSAAVVESPTMIETPGQPAGSLQMPQPTGDGPRCPSCDKQLACGALICVECGIHVQTGRAILTSQDTALDTVYDAAERIIRIISWIIPFGIYPVASEAYGAHRPYVIRALAILTVLTSFWFLYNEYVHPEKMRTLKNYMLWCGNGKAKERDLVLLYEFTGRGDEQAFEAKMRELKGKVPDTQLAQSAHEALRPDQQCFGRYQSSQLITHAFIHGGFFHMAGNMLFMMVLGTRVNAVIGNVLTLVMYPLLAIAGGAFYMQTSVTQPPHPMIGASGAIMGLAGMYLVLVPAYKVHVAFWYRLPFLLTLYHLTMRLFAVRGFWVVLFYIAFDVIATVLGAKDDVAHWAHLGGFIVGIVLALFLLLARLVNCRGGDIISALMGRYAWALVGKPNRAGWNLP